MCGAFYFAFMRRRYLLASVVGGLVGACCVLIVVYVTNEKALVVVPSNMTEAVSSLHSRINDFYIFAGIVITLLLAINVGVYVKADDDVEKHFHENFHKYIKQMERSINLARNKRKKPNLFK